jgi:cytoskeletal protein CcmA (bactofilin family)
LTDWFFLTFATTQSGGLCASIDRTCGEISEAKEKEGNKVFNKKREDQSEQERIEPVPPVTGGISDDPNVRKRRTSVIGPTLKFKGELSANEDLIIEGEIEGSIAHQDKNLTVGKEGRVKADINAKTVEIFGKVEGDIRGEDVVKLAKSAEVSGNIQCGRIVMEDGAMFCGSIEMTQKRNKSSDPTALPIGAAKAQAESAG